MTYRDDHDAAIARAEALQRELERTEADRDRLRAEVERLEHSAEPAPESALVSAAPTAMTAAEVTELVDELEAGLLASRSAGVWQIVLGCLFVAGALPLLFLSVPSSIVCSVVGMLTVVAGAVRNGGDYTAILAAVRDAPERIVALHELAPSTGAPSLRISTGYHAAYCKTRKSGALVAKLARRCPAATVSKIA